MEYHELLFSPRFFEFLLKIDQSTALKASEQECHCGGPLHKADFFRSGHGLPPGCDDKCRRRFSLCCGRDGCRQRLTPESLRFLRRRVFVGLALVLLPLLCEGAKVGRVRQLRKKMNVSRQTVDQWRLWWATDFPASRFWKEWSGRHPGVVANLPQSLLSAFEATSVRSKTLTSLLRFLSSLGIN